jgi:DnaK suppressor protein
VSASRDGPDGGGDSAAVLGSLRDERARVLARITALERGFHDIVERSSDASRDDEHDPEGATIAFERAQVSALLAAARAQLVEIDLAEARIGRGEHDRCERCGAGIPAERRSARPTARTCVRCAA